RDVGCWDSLQPLPAQLLDVEGAALGGKFYVLAEKTAAGHQTAMYIYDPATDTWTTGPNLPGPGVEDPAVVAANGLLYVFGGAATPFFGAVTNAAVYIPATGAWTALAPMPIGR